MLIHAWIQSEFAGIAASSVTLCRPLQRMSLQKIMLGERNQAQKATRVIPLIRSREIHADRTQLVPGAV